MKRGIVTYWEGPVSWLERLSVSSMLASGHAVDLFTFDAARLRNAGLGVDVHEVRDILPDRPPITTYREQGRFELYSDIVRLALLRLGRGIWCDADCIVLNPFSEAEDQCLMGWVQEHKRINNAVLSLPPGSAILETYWNAVSDLPVRVPWATRRVRLMREAGILLGRQMPSRLQKMSIGPRALTFFVERFGLRETVSPKVRFYPLIDEEAPALVDPDDRRACSAIEARTDVVHAWRGMLNALSLIGERPPATSWAGRKCRELGI